MVVKEQPTKPKYMLGSWKRDNYSQDLLTRLLSLSLCVRASENGTDWDKLLSLSVLAQLSFKIDTYSFCQVSILLVPLGP